MPWSQPGLVTIPLGFLVMGLMRHARYGRYRAEYSYRHHVAPWNAPTHR